MTKIVVDDEYDEVEPSVTLGPETLIDQTIQLRAAREDEDKDGRKYTVKVLTTDVAGNTSLATIDVIVPHDEGK